jgi:hypothetical protein
VRRSNSDALLRRVSLELKQSKEMLPVPQQYAHLFRQM